VREGIRLLEQSGLIHREAGRRLTDRLGREVFRVPLIRKD
jgi:hypothetical protein